MSTGDALTLAMLSLRLIAAGDVEDLADFARKVSDSLAGCGVITEGSLAGVSHALAVAGAEQAVWS